MTFATEYSVARTGSEGVNEGRWDLHFVLDVHYPPSWPLWRERSTSSTAERALVCSARGLVELSQGCFVKTDSRSDCPEVMHDREGPIFYLLFGVLV